MAVSWWREPAAADTMEGDAASRMWRSACGTLMAPNVDEAWKKLEEASPPDSMWHSLKNCVAHQAGVWQSLLDEGMDDVIQPAAFKLALVLRHTQPEVTVTVMAELLRSHPQSQDLTSYVLALLTDDELGCSNTAEGEHSPASPAPDRDLLLFGDLELSVLAAPRDQYGAHAQLVRAEYGRLSHTDYIGLRIRVLNQFTNIPKVFHTPEFTHLEGRARENVDRELRLLREDLKRCA